MNLHEVDVTYTVKTSESQGRKLIKNIITGKTRWECDDEEHDLPPQKKPKKTRAPSTQD